MPMPDRAGRRGRGDRGSTLIEVAVALALLAFVAAGVVRHISASQRATVQARVQDEATAVAYDFLERARAFGCGIEVGGEAGLLRKADRCGGLGTATAEEPGGINDVYDVRVATSWAMSAIGSRPGSCAAFVTGNPRPNMLVRTIEVRWAVRAIERELSASTVEAIPGDAVPFNSEVRGALVIEGTEDTVVGLVDLDTGLRIERPAVQYGTDWCVWFPFLLEGIYQVELNGSALRTISVVPRATVCEHEAGGPC